MAKPRMTNEHKNWLRDNLIRNMEHTFRMSHEDAVAAVTGGSVPMFVDISRRIVRNNPQYASTHSLGTDPEDWFNAVRKAFGEWIAYKAGVRHDESAEPVEASTAEEPAEEPASPVEPRPTEEPIAAEASVEATEETAPDTL